MIPYKVGKLAPNSTHSTSGLVKYVPDRGYFRAIPSQTEEKFVTSPPPSIVERFSQRWRFFALVGMGDDSCRLKGTPSSVRCGARFHIYFYLIETLAVGVD